MSYPCGNCGGNCTTDCVFCENCNIWFHYRCENLLKKHFMEMGKKKNIACDYICSKCTKTPAGTYDFEKSLKRLENYANSGNLEAGASLEMILLRGEKTTPLINRKDLVYSSDFSTDRVSKQILDSLNMSVAGRTPVYVSGDGNCLYNAISVGICGNESLSTELRVRTCLELIKNRHAYRNAPNARDLFFVSPNYDDAIKSSACKGKYACAWEMQAAATVVGCPIQSVYPPRNGLLDKAIGILNTVFTPVSSKSKKDPLVIMWSSARYSFVGSWLPNHFVPLIDTKPDSVLDIFDVDEFPPLNSTTVNESCNACPTIFDDTPILRNADGIEFSYPDLASQSETASVSDSAGTASVSDSAGTASVSDSAGTASVSDSAGTASVSDSAGTASVSDSASVPGETASVSAASVETAASPSVYGTGIQSPPLHFGSETFHSVQDSVESFPETQSVLSTDITFSDNETSETLEPNSTTEKSLYPRFSEHINSIPKNKFLDTNKIIDKLSSFSENEVLKEMPRCKKENVYFLLDNSENIEKKEKGYNMEFWDNCGTWASKSLSVKTTFFANFNGRVRSVLEKESVYGIEIKKKFTPLEPQPDKSEIFVLKRYYGTLARDNNYKKRISWFEHMPGSSSERYKTVSLVEYLGTFPADEGSKHGNARKTNQEYVRTSSKTKENVLTALKNKQPVREIFKEHFDTDHAPRDSKMIENMKSKLSKEANPGNRKNVADDIQAILNLTSVENPFVREVVQLAGKPPNLICYTDNQLKHLSKACKTSVIGIDRTFNLGPCFVTTTVFQDQNLRRKGKDVSPILLGPLFLHWDGTFHTYQRFFTHLAAVLETPLLDTELGTCDLVVGSDEEKALVKAVKCSFSDAKLTLCTRHLEENLKRQLKNKVGMPENSSKQIVGEIFGPDGLTSLDTSVSFAQKATEIERRFGEKVGPYLTDKLIPTIREHVFEICKTDERIPINWKNNNCEAMNHILKLNLDWKPAKIPDLVKMLEKEINLQESLTRGALYGTGNFELSHDALCLRVPQSVWQQKKDYEKQQLFRKFLSFGTRKPSPTTTITSTDGNFVMPKTKTVARKPGQSKKRVRVDKTVTKPKRRKLEET